MAETTHLDGAPEDHADKTLFSALLTPHRSLSKNGFTVLMILAGGVLLVQGFFFFVTGAWPIATFCGLDTASKQFMLRAEQKLGLSARAHHRLVKIARTIADLAGDKDISLAHLQEAMIYRGEL